MNNVLQKSFSYMGITVSDYQLEQFNKYFEFLIEYNENVNLTAITEKEQVAIKHFADCGSLLSVLDIKPYSSVIDVGTGAGFPGMVLKILRPDLKLTLLDSLNKRIVFLKKCSSLLNLDVACVHARAEVAAKNSAFRQMFDIATSRAVANLTTLSEYCLPFVKKGGVFAPLKGPAAEDEIIEAKNAIKILGGNLREVKNIKLGELAHKIVLVDKICDTPQKYPRNGAKPINNPLK